MLSAWSAGGPEAGERAPILSISICHFGPLLRLCGLYLVGHHLLGEALSGRGAVKMLQPKALSGWLQRGWLHWMVAADRIRLQRLQRMGGKAVSAAEGCDITIFTDQGCAITHQCYALSLYQDF